MPMTSPGIDNFAVNDTTSRGGYKTDVATGSVAMAWTWTGTESGAHAIAAFAPAAAASTVKTLAALGVG